MGMGFGRRPHPPPPTNFTNLLWARSTLETDLITNISPTEHDYMDIMKYSCPYYLYPWSSGGVVVKLLLAEQGVRFPASPLRFQRLVISCFQVAIWLKDGYCEQRRKSLKQPSNRINPTNLVWGVKFFLLKLKINILALVYPVCIFGKYTLWLQNLPAFLVVLG